jgi:transcriptional regulator GlxA family with amidase domain
MQGIRFLVLPGFQVMSFAALSVFEFANKEMGEPVYDVRLLSETGMMPQRSSSRLGRACTRVARRAHARSKNYAYQNWSEPQPP